MLLHKTGSVARVPRLDSRLWQIVDRSTFLTLFRAGSEKALNGLGGRFGPPLRSRFVVVRFSKSWTLWFPLVLRNSEKKFYRDRAKNTAPTNFWRKSARATPPYKGYIAKNSKWSESNFFFNYLQNLKLTNITKKN